jgi:hypothetical protein
MLIYKQPSSYEHITFSIGVLEAVVYYKDVAMCNISFPREVPSDEFKLSLVGSIIDVLATAYDDLLPDMPYDDLGKNGFTFIDHSWEELEGVDNELEEYEEAWEQSASFLDSLNEEHL